MIKKIVQYPLKFVDGIAVAVSGAAGGIGLSQFPQYIAQYVQRLGGHVDEVKSHLGQYVEAANRLGFSLEEFVQQHATSPRPAPRETARIITELVERQEYLQSSLETITTSGPATKLFSFLSSYDPEIAERVYESFQPGISTSAEAVGYALVGLVLGYGLYKGITALLKLPFKLGKKGGDAK